MKEKFMQECLKYAIEKTNRNEIPIAALLVKNDKILCKCANNKNIKNNVLGHAEILCIQKACKKLKRWNLNDCELYVTLKPCEMCELVIREAHIEHTYFLIDRLPIKKTYSKSQIVEIESLENEKNFYQKKLQQFFKNKR